MEQVAKMNNETGTICTKETGKPWSVAPETESRSEVKGGKAGFPIFTSIKTMQFYLFSFEMKNNLLFAKTGKFKIVNLFKFQLWVLLSLHSKFCVFLKSQVIVI